MSTLQAEMKRLSGTQLDATGAANVWAGTVGLSLQGALNVKAGNALPGWRSTQGVLNQLAGTSGLAPVEAARRIV